MEYCRKRVTTELYLWDMRCWGNYKDKTEIIGLLERLKQEGYRGSELNCGHVVLCIRAAIEVHNVSAELVAEWFLENPNIQFKDRLVKCWDNPNLCPRFRETGGNYSKCECGKICNGEK